MSFINSITTCIRKYFSISGRAKRREFWFWIAFCTLVLFIATMIDGIFIAPARGFLPFEAEAGRPAAIFALAVLTIPTITAAIRRLHDSNFSGWWLLLAFTGIGALPLAYFLVKGANKGENNYES